MNAGAREDLLAARHAIALGDNLEWMRALRDGCAHLVYADPPFNTGRKQTRVRLKTVRDAEGDRTGFYGARYRSERVASGPAFCDAFDDYLGFMEPRLAEARRLLAPTGSLVLHVDPRESHYLKVLLDRLFGRASFQNEIVWAYDYGARSKHRWSGKHDVLLWYAKDPRRYTFRLEDCDRVPYLAEKLVGPVKAARGKTPTDVWWHTIVSPTGREKTGYPTQKPLGILERIVRVHSNPDDVVLDPFAGSGTAGEAAAKHGRRFLLIDHEPAAVEIMRRRLARFEPAVVLPPEARPANPEPTLPNRAECPPHRVG